MNPDLVPPSTNVESFTMTPDRKTLITFESLKDQNSHKDIKIQALKFWSRDVVEDGFQGFEMDWMVHDPSDTRMALQAINNN
jgi:hypothetical protein